MATGQHDLPRKMCRTDQLTAKIETSCAVEFATRHCQLLTVTKIQLT